MIVSCCRLLVGCRSSVDAPGAAVVTHPVVVVHDDGLIHVDIGDVAVHMHDRAVVVERAAAPLSADESHATVAIAVIYAAVETDMRPPIAAIPEIDSARPTPVARGPEQADGGCGNPGARHPVVA
jgi:hypothetical protein